MPAQSPPAQPSALELLRIWTQIGSTSFGGGQAVFLLAYQRFVERGGWITDEAWAEAYGLTQLVPGMNLVGLAAILGNRFAGPAGAAVSVAGLLLPSVVITIGLAASLTAIRRLPGINAAIHGLVLGAAGGSLVVTYGLARPLLQSSAREGRVMLATAIGAVVAVALLLALGVPVVVLILGSGTVLSLLAWKLDRGSVPKPDPARP